jgi:hypothetical protein
MALDDDQKAFRREARPRIEAFIDELVAALAGR